MPREIADRDRVVEAVKNLALTAELFEEQNGKPKYAGDLEVIVRGRDYGTANELGLMFVYSPTMAMKRLRGRASGVATLSTLVDGYTRCLCLTTLVIAEKLDNSIPGTCFGEMALLAGIERNATVTVPVGTTATILEVTRPALRLLRKLPKFGLTLDETYRAHGFGRVLEDITNHKQHLSQPVQNHCDTPRATWSTGNITCSAQKVTPIDKLILIRERLDTAHARRSVSRHLA